MPHSARVALHATAWLHGQAGSDDLLAEFGDPDLALAFAEVTDRGDRPLTAPDVLLRLRRDGARGAGLALPVAGDPVGLGGPPEFNADAMHAGEAVVVGGIGLVPHIHGESLVWRLHPAQSRQVPDVGEADRALRGELLSATRELARREVASWHPELADELQELRRAGHIETPPGTPPSCAVLAADAVRALALVHLAQRGDGAAGAPALIEERRVVLSGLAGAARRGLVAACSWDSWPANELD